MYDIPGAGRRATPAELRVPIVMVLVTTLLVGCNVGGAGSPGGAGSTGSSPDPSTATASEDSPSGTSPRPMAQHRIDKLAHLLERVEVLNRVPPDFELRDVDYTSPNDAVAYFVAPGINDRGTIIATTDDNWAHAARIRISDELADLVDYAPLGRGAVAIKAQDQYPTRMYPPFVLYPDGDTKPLRVTDRRMPDDDTEVVGRAVHDLLFYYRDERSPGLWAADVEAAVVFPIARSPNGVVHQHLPGRDRTLMNVLEYRRGIAGGVWRYETSPDDGRSWHRTDVSLPLGHMNLHWYTDVTTHAVGPGRRQAIAMSHAWEDLPLYMWELWWTDDEKEFRRVRLPRDRLRFGGMAFASDGALLIAEVGGSDHYCDQLTCNRPGRIWRLASGDAVPELLPSAPQLFGPFWAVGIRFSGGLIVARTGMRTIAVSKDGYVWTDVTPGRRDLERRRPG